MSSKLCGCGGTAGNTASKVKAHEKTKKHQNWLATQQSSKPSSSSSSKSSSSSSSSSNGSSKQKSTTTTTSSSKHKSSRSTDGTEQPPLKKTKITTKVDSVPTPDPAKACFDQYKDADDERVISMDGIMDIMQALNFDPASDVRVLVLLWKLQTDSKGRRNPSEVSEIDFLAGMKRLGCSCIADLRRKIPSFDPGFLDKKAFQEFYSFAFNFSRENKTFKTIDTESVIQLLPIVLDSTRAPHLSPFTEFLAESSQTRITFDQWDSFLQFNDQVALDLSNYEDDGAWPLLFDEYVEWVQAKGVKTK